MAPLVAALLALVQGSSQTIDLTHRFIAKQKSGFKVLSHITAEHRGKGLDTWIPEDLDLNYNFTVQVLEMRSDGIAVVRYLRPTMTEIQGETVDEPPKTNVQPVNLDYRLTVSPINEILEQKRLSAKQGVSTDGDRTLLHFHQQGAESFFAPFISDIHRLALFIGGIQDSLDFAPKLPLNSVKIGDTWKRTVGFQPQKLKGKNGESAVQRLDYTFTYLGPTTNGAGKQVLRVEAKLSFATDLGDYFKQILEDHANETNVTKVPLHFDGVVDFDLDPTTRETLHVQGATEGGYQIFLSETGSDAAEEERFKGKTTMDLVGQRVIP